MIFTRWCFAVTGKIFLVKMGKYASAKLYWLLYNIQRIKRWVWSEHSKAAATWPESDVLANSYMYVWAWWPISSTLFSGSRTTKWLDVCSSVFIKYPGEGGIVWGKCLFKNSTQIQNVRYWLLLWNSPPNSLRTSTFADFERKILQYDSSVALQLLSSFIMYIV